MTTETLLAILAFGTMGAVAAFAYRNAQATEERRRSNAPKSTLAADAADTAPKGRRPPDT